MTHVTTPRGRPEEDRQSLGQALVEMALVLPILVLLLTGLLQFGVLLSAQIGLVNGVREAARYGSVLTTTSSAEAAPNGSEVISHLEQVLADGMPGFAPTNLASASACYTSYQNPGSSPATYSVRLSVSASYGHTLFMPIISNLIDALDGTADNHLRLDASEAFRVENVPLPSTDVPVSEPGTCAS